VADGALTDGATAALQTRRPRRDIALLRVVAIVGVVLIHVTGLTTTTKELHGSAVWWAAEVVNLTSRFCVPLFVLVSGALLLRPGSRESAADFYRRRLDRLLPALVVWYAVYSAFAALVLHRHRSPTNVLALALSGRTYTALYFFWLILGLYLVTPALRKLLAGHDVDQLTRIGVGLTALTCAWQTTTLFVGRYSTVDVSATPTAFTYWIPYVGYFVLGGALAQRAVPRAVAPYAAGAAVISAAGTVWVASGSSPSQLSLLLSSSYHGWFVAVTTVSLYLLAASLLPPQEDAPGLTMRMVTALGNVTLGVFAVHLLVLYALQHAGILTVTHGASRLTELAYLAVATVVLSFLVALAAARVPVLRRLV
jgi:surface polysaccharide O-acyltransferase-like enzyme